MGNKEIPALPSDSAPSGNLEDRKPPTAAQRAARAAEIAEGRELGSPAMSRVKRTKAVVSKRTYNDPYGIAGGPKRPD